MSMHRTTGPDGEVTWDTCTGDPCRECGRPNPPRTLTLFYISFATDEGFLGGCYVEADSMEAAPIVASVLGCNPGGEAYILPAPPDVPEDQRGRLLTKAELGPGSTIGELEDEGKW